jgi:Protein of unknown function (DUF3237)
MRDDTTVSRREFTKAGASLGAAVGLAGVAGLSGLTADAQQAPAAGRPDALRSEFLMDLILETATSATLGSRRIVAVTGGTFEGPKLKGTVHAPGADWTMRAADDLTILDVRTLLMTDDEQPIYISYRGVVHRPAGGETYWRVLPVFETASPKYDWLNKIVSVGVSFTIPQRVSYRIFQIL